jgi:hypothetical protein
LFGCGCGGLGFLTSVGNVFWVGFCVWGVFWGFFVGGCGLVDVGFWLFGCWGVFWMGFFGLSCVMLNNGDGYSVFIDSRLG